MKNSKNNYLSIGSRIALSKKGYATTLEERKYTSRVPYASVVGSIMYAMICIGPDMAYSLGVVSG